MNPKICNQNFNPNEYLDFSGQKRYFFLPDFFVSCENVSSEPNSIKIEVEKGVLNNYYKFMQSRYQFFQFVLIQLIVRFNSIILKRANLSKLK